MVLEMLVVLALRVLKAPPDPRENRERRELQEDPDKTVARAQQGLLEPQEHKYACMVDSYL